MGLSRSILAEHGVVASEQPLATLAGLDVLRESGNAFDAAVATSYALAVTLQSAGGLGGDFFGMFYEASTGKVHCLNASGWSPAGLREGAVGSFPESRTPQFGPYSVVVPGFVAGVSEMHRKFGSAEFNEILRPSIELASSGFPAGDSLARDTAKAHSELSPEAKEVFAPMGRPPVPGELIRQGALGKVIGEIAESGPNAFYSGWPASKMVDALVTGGAPFALDDFAEYQPEWVTPLKMDYRGTTVYEVPPNSMGATSLLMLKTLSKSVLVSSGSLSAKRIELTMKAALPAYARRDQMIGDPRFGRFDFDSFMSDPTSEAVSPTRIRSADTTAFSVADSQGNLVSAILSIFDRFGSRVFVPECGIMLNNRASGFSTSGPNRPQPRKRPLHTLSSLILERHGRPYLAMGASGGDHRPMQHALFVTNAVDYSMTAEENVAHPRFLWGGGARLIVEKGYELPQESGFEIQLLPYPGRIGVCQAVEISDGYKKGVCDVRGDGLPAGY